MRRPTPAQYLGGRVVRFRWGWDLSLPRWLARRTGYHYLTWSQDERPRLFLSTNGTPAGAGRNRVKVLLP